MSHLTHGALCNGIAGFALAAQWAGIRTIWTSDTDPFCNAVSRKHFPDAHQYGDIYAIHRPPYVDIISAGYPCQPTSYAGKRQGAEDDRWLWPQVLRLVTEVRPRWFLGENVAGHVTLGLAGVLADLETAGYEVWPLVLPACATGAPHRRDRVWIIAHADRAGCQKQHPARVAGRPGLAARCADAVATNAGSLGGRTGQPQRPEARPEANHGTVGHSQGFAGHVHAGAASSGQESEGPTRTTSSWPDWWLTQPALCAPDDGLSGRLVRPDPGGATAGARRAKADEKTWRRSTLHAAGNALVPQIPELFFQFIADYEAGLIPNTL